MDFQYVFGPFSGTTMSIAVCPRYVSVSDGQTTMQKLRRIALDEKWPTASPRQGWGERRGQGRLGQRRDWGGTRVAPPSTHCLRRAPLPP